MRAALAALALTAGSMCAAAAPAGTPVQIEPLVTGTAHQALFALAFDGAVGSAVGAAGQILETQDGGKSWKDVNAALTSVSLLGVDVTDSQQIAVGQLGTILLRDAAGHWRTSASGTQERLMAVGLNNKGLAVAVGSFGTVLKSADSGASWTAAAPDWAAYAEDGVQPHLYAVDVSESGQITVAGEFGLILRSADQGTTWQPLHKGEASLFGLQLRADGVGYAVGQSGTVLRTADHGATWVAAHDKSGATLSGVSATADGTVVATGMREMLVSRDHGASWTRVAEGVAGAFWFADAGSSGDGPAVLAVGQAGQIIRIRP